MAGWTQEHPTQPGFYWVYAPLGAFLKRREFFGVIEVTEEGGVDGSFKVGSYWQGPLEPPSLPTTEKEG